MCLKNLSSSDLIGSRLGEGIGEGYMQGSDERAIRGAIESLPENASYRDILTAISGVSTYNPEAKQQAASNLLKSHELEAREKQYERKVEDRLDKENKKVQAEQDKIAKEAQLEEAEQNFLASLEGKNLSGMEIYTLARQNNLPPVSAKRVADLKRLAESEDRRSKKDLTDAYDYEIRRLDQYIREVNKPLDKRNLQEERKKLIEDRSKDLERWEKGERNFKPSIHNEPTKPKFDKDNPEHQATARALYEQLGDKEKVREALREEFDI